MFAKRIIIFLSLLVFVAGCPVTQPQDTPVPATKQICAVADCEYWIYVPSYYSTDRDWPLVITLHGTHGFDSSSRQIDEWKALAEEKGLIVVAPALRSVQGIMPVIPKLWMDDLEADESSVLAVMDEVCQKYRIGRDAVMLTGFSAGGYPLYYVGLRNPRRFSIIIARSCSSSLDIFESIKVGDELRKMPIMIFWAKDDPQPVQSDSWQAYRWLREHRCFETKRKRIQGGHLRRPDKAYEYWEEFLPAKYKQ